MQSQLNEHSLARDKGPIPGFSLIEKILEPSLSVSVKKDVKEGIK